MTFPYKIYQSRNISVPAYIYLGKAAIAGYYGSQTSFFPHQVLKDCEDVFLYGTLIGSTNLKITAASAEDPYIYLDTRWTNFSVSADTSSSYSFVQSVKTDTNFTLNANFRSLSSDGSLLIKSGANSTFFWNGLTTIPDPDIQIPATCQTDNATVEDGQIIIKRYDYSFIDAPITDSFWAQKAVSLIDDKVVDQATYTILMQLKALVGSECIKVEDTDRGTIKISFDKDNCPCGCFNPDSSSSQSSIVDICYGLSEECLNLSSSSTSESVVSSSSLSNSSLSLSSFSSASFSSNSVSSQNLNACTDCGVNQTALIPAISVTDNFTEITYNIPSQSLALTYLGGSPTCTWQGSYTPTSFSATFSISFDTDTDIWSMNFVIEGGGHCCFGFAVSGLPGISCNGGNLSGSVNLITPTDNCSTPDSGGATWNSGGVVILS